MSSSSNKVHTNDNTACCSIPPVQSDYKPKGKFEKVGDVWEKAYVVGESETRALICVYDIFGFWPQTEQGADILSSALDGAKVFMPDFLLGKPWPQEKFPPKTKEDKAKLAEFFNTIANPEKTSERLLGTANYLRSIGYTSVGIYGFCWGGKVCLLAGSHDDLHFESAVSIVHPAMLDVEDVEFLRVPLAMFPSKDEPKDVVDDIVKALKSKPFADKCVHKTYPTMHHGWAAARADLNDPENKKQYEDVYSRVAAFFKENLK